MLFAGREVRIGKNCARALEYGPYSRPYSRPRAQFFPIRTDLGRQITRLFFSSVEYFVSSFCVEFSLQPFSNLVYACVWHLRYRKSNQHYTHSRKLRNDFIYYFYQVVFSGLCASMKSWIVDISSSALVSLLVITMFLFSWSRNVFLVGIIKFIFAMIAVVIWTHNCLFLRSLFTFYVLCSEKKKCWKRRESWKISSGPYAGSEWEIQDRWSARN